MTTPAPLGAATDAIDDALREEARRLTDKFRWRVLLNIADQLLEDLEQLNLQGKKGVKAWLGNRIAALEHEIGIGRGAPPTTPGAALDRVFRVQGVLFRLLQPWWWDLHLDEVEDLAAESAGAS